MRKDSNTKDYKADKDILMRNVLTKCAEFMEKYGKDVFSMVVSSCHTMMSIDAAGVVRRGNLLLVDMEDANSEELQDDEEDGEGDE